MWSNKGSEIKCAHKLGTKLGRPTDPNFGPKSLPEGPRDTLGSGKLHPKSVPGASRSSPERRKSTRVPKVGQTDAESRPPGPIWGPGRDPKIDQKRARGEKVGPGSRLSSSFMADTRERRFRDRFWIRFGGSGPLGKHGVGGVSSTSPLFEKVTKKGPSGTPFWSPEG